jgi:hypothetical protein
MTAEEFRKAWLIAHPNIIHIPSEHEIWLMEEYHKSEMIRQGFLVDEKTVYKLNER